MVAVVHGGTQVAVIAEPNPVVHDHAMVASRGQSTLAMQPFDANVFRFAEVCTLGADAEVQKTKAFGQARIAAQLEIAKAAHENGEQRHAQIDAAARRIPIPGGTPELALDLVHAAADWAEGHPVQALLVGAMSSRFGLSSASRINRAAARRRTPIWGGLDQVGEEVAIWSRLVADSAYQRANDLGIILTQLTVVNGARLRVGKYASRIPQPGEKVNPIADAESWATTMRELGIREITFGDVAETVRRAVERVLNSPVRGG